MTDLTLELHVRNVIAAARRVVKESWGKGTANVSLEAMTGLSRCVETFDERAALQQAQQPACPYILTSDEGTSHCSLAESAQQPGAKAVGEVILGGIVGGEYTGCDVDWFGEHNNLEELQEKLVRGADDVRIKLYTQPPCSGGAQAALGFVSQEAAAQLHNDAKWLDVIKGEKADSTDIALYTHPQPPSIPEPSEEDVDVAAAAYDKEADEARKSNANFPQWNALRAALTTYTARLRERIGGGL